MDNSAAAKIMMASGSLKNFEVLSVTENNYHIKAEHNKPPAWKEVDLDIPVDEFAGTQNGTYDAEDYELEAWTKARAEIGLQQAEFTQNHTSKTHTIGYATAVVNLAQTQGSFTENKLYSSGREGGYNYYSVNVDDHESEWIEQVGRYNLAIQECAKKQGFAHYKGREVIPAYHDVPAGTSYQDVVAISNTVRNTGITDIGTTTTTISDGDSTTKTVEIEGQTITVQNGDVVTYNGQQYRYGGDFWHTYTGDGMPDGVSDASTVYDTTLELYTEAYRSENVNSGTIWYDLYSSDTGEWVENPDRADGHLAVISIPESVDRNYGSHVQVTSFEVTDPTTGAYTITARWYNADGDIVPITESGTITRHVNSCTALVGFGASGHTFGIREPIDNNYRNWDGDYSYEEGLLRQRYPLPEPHVPNQNS